MAVDRTSRQQADLADPSRALVSYLDDLLHTATSTATETGAPVRESRRETAPAPEPETQVRVDESVSPEVPPPEAPVSPVAEPVPATTASQRPETRQAPQAEPEPPAPAMPEGRPDWAGKPFECLIFRVAGLQLAVPLVLLGAIHRIDEKIKPIPGRPPWYMGMLPDRGVNLKVVDSARWIMPGRAPADAREGYRFVIRLDDSDWSLACDEVAESFTLDPDQVRWRTSRSKRPWLAGTVVQQMCALIDVGAMARLLARAEREQRLDLD